MKSNREKILLGIFGAVVVGIGVVVLGSWLNRHLAARQAVLVEKVDERRQMQGWIAERELWEQRADWMQAHPTPDYQGPESEAAFVQMVQKSLSAAGIEIIDQKVEEGIMRDRLIEVSMDLTLQCSLEQFVRWLHAAQNPTAFRIVRRLGVRSDVGQSRVRAELRLSQIFSKP